MCEFTSGGPVPGLGRTLVYYGAQSTIRIQRKPIHIHGNIQWIFADLFSERLNVSS